MVETNSNISTDLNLLDLYLRGGLEMEENKESQKIKEDTQENKKRRESAIFCYEVLKFINFAIKEMKSFRSNRALKKWLLQLRVIALKKKMRRAFWLLVINDFIYKDKIKKKIVITKSGQEFLESVFDERAKILKLNLKEKDLAFKKAPRYVGMINEISGKGWRRINYRKLQKKSTQSGWICEFLKLHFPDKLNSASFALMRADQVGAIHEHSKTEEIFIFLGGHGYMEIGEEKKQVPVNRKYLVIVEADTPHKVIPVNKKDSGQFLDMIVVSLPGWESENEYKIGESQMIATPSE